MTDNENGPQGTFPAGPEESPGLPEAFVTPTPPAPPPPPRVPGFGGAPAVPPGWQPPAAAAYPATRTRRSGLSALWVILVLLVLGAITIGAAMFMVSQNSPVDPGALLAGKVGVISIEGVIADGGRGGLFAGPPGARAIMADLRRAGKDESLKAVVLLINSPGGSAPASAAIYREVMRLRQRKHVVACMTDMAASGGYYVAAACEKIVAESSTLTGSIGVRFGGMSYYGLMQKLGVTDATQTAGKYKDTGSPLRAAKPEEKALIQGMLNSIYDQFIEAVHEGRGMDVARVRRLAEGRVYTGAQAKQVGLVDDIGDFYDAIALAGRLGGIHGEPKVEYLGQPTGLLEQLMSSSESFQGLLHRSGPVISPVQPQLGGPMLILPFVYEMVPVAGGIQAQ
jgi:protease IV